MENFNGSDQSKKSLSIGWVVFISMAVLILGLAGGYYYSNATQESKETSVVTPTTEPTPAPTVTVTSTPESTSTPAFNEEKAKKEVCQDLFPDYKLNVEEASIGEGYCIVDHISINHADGGSGTKFDESGGPGAAWYATKINNKWKKVWETQDALPCGILWQYSFPTDMFNKCYDGYQQKDIEYVGID